MELLTVILSKKKSECRHLLLWIKCSKLVTSIEGIDFSINCRLRALELSEVASASMLNTIHRTEQMIGLPGSSWQLAGDGGGITRSIKEAHLICSDVSPSVTT